MIIRRIFSLAFTLLTIGCLALPAIPAFADPVTSQGCNVAGNVSSYCNQNGSNPIAGPNGVINKAVRLISIIGGVAAVITIIIGGFLFISSGGDPNSVKNARTTIIYAVVGLIIIAASQAIITFIVDRI